mgnify:FL=1
MGFTDNASYIMEVFCVAFAATLLLTPFSIKLAGKIGAIDVPKDNRRMHVRSIPRFGGLSIFFGSLISIYLFAGTERNVKIALLGGTLIYLLGVIDDLKNLPAGIKFVWQTVVAILMYAFGLRISFITNYFGSGLWGLSTVVCFFVTVVWIVGVTNTINLVDGLDGLAAGISAIVSLSLAYISFIHGDIFGVTAVYSTLTALAGACMGFLPYNFSPAKTFMGDGGSLYLGFMIAIMSVVSPLKQATVISISVPVIALAIPIFDTFSAIIRRKLRHQPIMSADKEHLHHKLIAAGYDQRRSVIMLYGITALMGMAAILISRELFKDALVLIVVVISYLYVFVTDSAYKREKVKEKKVAERILAYFNHLYKKGNVNFEKIVKVALDNNKKMFVVTANPETLMTGLRDDEFNALLNDESVTIVPDGIGVVKAAEILGIECSGKITGVDLATFLLKTADKEKKSMYLFGAKEEVLKKLVHKIETSYPNIILLGSKNGYTKDKDKVFDEIISMKPDIVLVALGIPMQEFLINKHFEKADKGIFVGVGGSFDVLSGSKKRAPQYFINHNIEWLYRIATEPNRLKRFYRGNIKFISIIRKVNKFR